MRLPRLYAIADRGTLDARGIRVAKFARELRDAGAMLLQYRDKVAAPQEVLRVGAAIGDVFAGVRATLILNDRADLAALLGWGVHVGQGDLSPEDARAILLGGIARPSQRREGWATLTGGGPVVGISTHNEQQILRLHPDEQRTLAGDPACAQVDNGAELEGFDGPDYAAIGPVFGTRTKLDAEPVVGLEGVRRARLLTRKPLVAIGGITRENARSVIDAGAASVAVIGGLLVPGESVEKVARDFLEILR